VEGKITRIFNELGKKAKMCIDNALKNRALTSTQNSVLLYIYNEKIDNNKIVNQIDIEKQFSIKASSVNSILKLLEIKGFVEKKASQEDKRKNYILITDKALEYIKDGKQTLKNVENKIKAGILKEEFEVFKAVLKKMKKNLDGLMQNS